jgi:hypothetical protein
MELKSLEPIYIPEYISHEQELSLINLMPQKDNSGGVERNNFVRWGCPTPYSSNIIGNEIPEAIRKLNVPFDYDSVSMNEYHGGQKLDFHHDLPYSGNKIYVLSLLSSANLYFKWKDTQFKVVLERRSLCVLQDELRWVWMHCATAESHRYSIVFRNSKEQIPSSANHYCPKCESYHYLGRGTCNL